MSTVLYLVRHGAIIRSPGKSFIGQIDLPLSEEGVDQAWSLREWLEPIEFSCVYSSDLSRAHRTCQIIAGKRHSAIQLLPALREISLGEWEGFSFPEIEARFPEEYAERGRDMANWRPPGGESFADCQARVLAALRNILECADGNLLVVGHAGVNRVLLCELLGIPLANLHRIGQEYGSLNVIDFTPRRPKVTLMNYSPVSTRPMDAAAGERIDFMAGVRR